ncbi:MAG TPA: type II toxin-antitoxin system RelE/ParE family toxin [Methylomirabilota bacterium]|nr:type II toxin-antitoxin system RelE/ParE family toxin [Methylomirabilota bacterium]
MKPVNVHSAARRELAEAMAWYDERCAGLGLDLLDEFQKAAAKLKRHPEFCPRYKRTNFRKQKLERFPYLIFFLELPDCVWIAAIAHGAREPDYWKHRKPE